MLVGCANIVVFVCFEMKMTVVFPKMCIVLVLRAMLYMFVSSPRCPSKKSEI